MNFPRELILKDTESIDQQNQIFLKTKSLPMLMAKPIFRSPIAQFDVIDGIKVYIQ